MVNKKVIIGAGLSFLVILGAVTLTSGSVLAEGTDNNQGSKFGGMRAGIMRMKAPNKELRQERIKTDLAGLVSGGTFDHFSHH